MDSAAPAISELFRSRPDVRADLACELVTMLRARPGTDPLTTNSMAFGTFAPGTGPTGFGYDAEGRVLASERRDIVNQLSEYLMSERASARLRRGLGLG